MPSFNKKIELDFDCLSGLKLDQNSQVESAKLSIQIEIAKGTKNVYDLRDRNAEEKGMKIEGDFVFVLYDDANDHLLLSAKIFTSDFITY